jgi:cobaltochelatase CobN
VVQYQAHAERLDFVVALAALVPFAAQSQSRQAAGIDSGQLSTQEGRLGNGVGLDTPASVIHTAGAAAAGLCWTRFPRMAMP